MKQKITRQLNKILRIQDTEQRRKEETYKNEEYIRSII